MTETTNTIGLTEVNIEFVRACAPQPPEAVWEIESLLLRVFEHGDYSFRSALSGKYCRTLNCTFFLARHGGRLVGAAGCLRGLRNGAISVLGPVAVQTEYRGNGIGTRLVTSLIKHLKREHCMAIYLGVPNNSPARSLYKGLGFRPYKGVVMRYLFCSESRFEEDYFGKSRAVKIRRAQWGDLAGAQALVCTPCSMYTLDFGRNIFSSKYVEPSKFLSVFPEMMETFARQGGLASVLVSGQMENVVGLAHIRRLLGKARQHVAELDFCVHDNFLSHSEPLVRATLEEAVSLSLEKINCYCLGCDRLKQSVLQGLGAKRVAELGGNVRIYDTYENVLVYEVGGCFGAGR